MGRRGQMALRLKDTGDSRAQGPGQPGEGGEAAGAVRRWAVPRVPAQQRGRGRGGAWEGWDSGGQFYSHWQCPCALDFILAFDLLVLKPSEVSLRSLGLELESRKEEPGLFREEGRQLCASGLTRYIT